MQNSIVIPTFNGEKNLSATVKSLIGQNYPKADFEILIIDNASTDKTKDISSKLIKQYPQHNIRYIFEPIPGLLSGRHRGAQEAKAEILTYIDDDITADKGWLEAIMRSFSKTTTLIVGGRNLPEYEVQPPVWIEDFWRETPYGGRFLGHLSLLDYGKNSISISPLHVWGLNLSIRKSTLKEIGGFNPDTYPKYLQKYQGDGETGLALKLIKKNIIAEYQPDALVYHRIPQTRLTLEFFKKRSYFQGVSDSYTHYRDKFLYGKEINSKSDLYKIAQKIYKFTKSFFNKTESGRSIKIRALLRKSYSIGYKFHQKQLKKDPKLIQWISKDTYWDYTLPEHIKKSVSNEKSY